MLSTSQHIVFEAKTSVALSLKFTLVVIKVFKKELYKKWPQIFQKFKQLILTA